MRLGDQDSTVHPDDPLCFTKNHFDDSCVLAVFSRPRVGGGRGHDLVEPHDRAFGFRHDLLCDHEDVAGLDAVPCSSGRAGNQGAEIRSAGDVGKAGKSEQLKVHGPGA